MTSSLRSGTGGFLDCLSVSAMGDLPPWKAPASGRICNPATSILACCLDTVVTCVDKRHQQHIFAIGIFEIATKECVASIMGICPGGSSKQRATVYALKQLALHILDSTHVGVSNLQVWKSWTPHLAMERFPDLHQGLEFEDYENLRPLLFLSHLQQEEGMKTRLAPCRPYTSLSSGLWLRHSRWPEVAQAWSWRHSRLLSLNSCSRNLAGSA